MMNDNIVNLVSIFESVTFSALRMGITFDSHLPPLNHDNLKPYIIPLSDDSDSEGYMRIPWRKEPFHPTH